ncbi:hypothetical protein IFM89_035528 [Coptis chinensis]|uniref:Nodulin-like domain-containing protein n=1 Tax=Coptis chinensis TaxID=261450 RepID=A0A835HDN1_9MAGN|nr:hypothetical protein IFM89_035528 [Coptis chinensis]
MVASELGKLLDCVCILAAKHLPLWLMLTIGIVLGSVAYVVQYLFLVNEIITLSYWHLIVLHILAGNSICWFNAVCCRTAEINFLNDHQTVIALVSTYSGLSGKLYTLLVEAVHGPGASSASTCLLLNCLVPIGVGSVFLIIVRDNPPINQIKSVPSGSFTFIFMIAAAIGAYSVFDSIAPAIQRVSPSWRVLILLILMILPIVVPIGMDLEKLKLEKWHFKFTSQSSSGDHEGQLNSTKMSEETIINIGEVENKDEKEEKKCGEIEWEKEEGEKEEVHGNELAPKDLIFSVNFWLDFWVYAFGATLIIAYFNDLGRISKTRVQADAPFLLAISSSFGFFGRLFTVMFDWFTRGKSFLSRPVSVVVLMVSMTASFFMLLASGDHYYIYFSTAILGVCSGVIATIIGSITSDLFGPKNAAMNNTILHANIPIGILIYGSLAALDYDSVGDGSQCSGFKCFRKTFMVWGSICSVGTILSFILYLRTRKLYRQRL